VSTESGAHPILEHEAVDCGRCRARVVWTTTERGKSMLVNLTPDPSGNVAVRLDHTRRARSRVLNSERPVLEGTERLHLPHVATCGKPAAGPIPARADGAVPLYLARERARQRPQRPRPRPTGGLW